MDKAETARIYPAAPLESVVLHEQQSLLKPSPPSYDQATATSAAATTAAAAATSNENGQTVVVIAPPTGAGTGASNGTGLPYGPHPIDVLCPFCHNYTRTRIRHKPTSRTHLIAVVLCVFQLYCFVCLPYLIGSCMKSNHYCGLCDSYLGTYGENRNC